MSILARKIKSIQYRYQYLTQALITHNDERTSTMGDQNTESTLLLPEQVTTNDTRGSSIPGCVFNFTNSIVGAGCIGLGAAIAASGGIAAVLCILFFAYLSKLSFDLLIELSEEGSYEQLAFQAYGRSGHLAVTVSRFLYSFGCLVAYTKIVKDNFASAVEGFGAGELNDDVVTLILSASIVLPLCLLRDMTLLDRVSIVKIAIVLSMLGTILYLLPANHITESKSFQNEWLVVRPGIIRSLGTFVFTFVGHHVVHLTYESLQPNIRTIRNWKLVSTYSVALSTILSMGIGIAVYVTFWEKTSSAIFELYPPSTPLNLAKLLLSFMMMFTYPLPFLTCRELIVLSIPRNDNDPWWILEGNQLVLSLHVLVTTLLWGLSTALALSVSTLGDVLDLVGSATGTIIAFVLPAMFSFKLKGYTNTACLIFVVGGTVGVVGTFQSLRKLLQSD